MPIRKAVRRGDSLWSLACRYLGSGDRYPQIYDFHNQEAARYRLRPIEKPDLIFVGQTILIPSRPKIPKPGSGTKAEGSHSPIPLNLKVVYSIGRDTPPIIYAASYGDYTIKTEMSGEIGIEIASSERYRHSLELFVSKDSIQAKQKLREAYDPALVALTGKPEMVFESGRVKIKAPIATKANAGPFTIEVQAEAPNHMSGTLKPPTLSGALEMGRRKFKYSADIELKAEVIWHPTSTGGPGEPVRVPVKENEPAYNPTDNAMDLTGFATMVMWTIVGTAMILMGARQLPMARGAISFQPLLHTVNPYNPRLRGHFNNDA